jgi:hypothetical protein
MGSDDGLLHSELLSFWTLFIVQYSKKLENTAFRKLDVFPSSGRGGGRTPSQLGPTERANLNHLTTCHFPKGRVYTWSIPFAQVDSNGL